MRYVTSGGTFATISTDSGRTSPPSRNSTTRSANEGVPRGSPLRNGINRCSSQAASLVTSRTKDPSRENVSVTLVRSKSCAPAVAAEHAKAAKKAKAANIGSRHGRRDGITFSLSYATHDHLSARHRVAGHAGGALHESRHRQRHRLPQGSDAEQLGDHERHRPCTEQRERSSSEGGPAGTAGRQERVQADRRLRVQPARAQGPHRRRERPVYQGNAAEPPEHHLGNRRRAGLRHCREIG